MPKKSLDINQSITKKDRCNKEVSGIFYPYSSIFKFNLSPVNGKDSHRSDLLEFLGVCHKVFEELTEGNKRMA